MEVKELLEKIKPLLRNKGELDNIDRKIKGYQQIIANLKKERTAIEKIDLEDEVIGEGIVTGKRFYLF